MKNFYFSALLFLFITAKSFAQTDHVFYLNKLPQKDTLLSGWKIQSGDNKEWAKPGYDDSKWQTADPGIHVKDLKELRKTGICWIRLHVKLDSTLIKQQITAWVFQYTASEIFLNGSLIKKYGSIGTVASNTVAVSPTRDLFNLKLQPDIDNVIAVRIAYQSGIFYSSPNFVPLSAFSMFINNYENSLANQHAYLQVAKEVQIVTALSSGAFLILTIVYMIYFLFDRSHKISLYYFFFSFFLCCLCVNLTAYFENNIESVFILMLAALGVVLSFIIGFLFMLLTIYTLFKYESRIVFKIFVPLAIAALVYFFYNGVTGFIIATNGFMVLCMIEGVRVSIWAIKHKKKGAVVILSGLIAAIMLGTWSGFLDQTTVLAVVTGFLSISGFPLGMSIYLGIQNAITNQKLRSTLEEVQTLSQQNILKEQEKQQILSNQNELLENQVNERTAELKQSLFELKSTQSQLIQSEKMASLGELTAGIAHEIQNPLNFVNNFSEVNKELVDEATEEIDKGNINEVRNILNDIKDNEEKINHHGKRADAIVKGMLQHSRQTKGIKEPTDINALCDEYLRLSYHGLRAKDKEFNADFKTDFDESIGKINIVPQDIGRVLLNLFNNAFYAVNEKQKLMPNGYQPTAEVKTRRINDKVEITISDNGNGIPQNIIDKIFQPFFTTKPTGQGTGLGLSLAYDIITKEHNGTIKAESKEGEGTTFIIQLPTV